MFYATPISAPKTEMNNYLHLLLTIDSIFD